MPAAANTSLETDTSRVPLRRYATLLLRYLKPHRGRMGLLSLCIFASIGMNLVNPQIIRYFIDTARDGGAMADLTAAAALFLALGVGRQFVYLASSYLGQDVGWRVTNRMRGDLAEHCMRLDMTFHHQRTPGEMVERVDGDTTALANFFSEFMVQVIGSLLLLVGVLVLVWREDWRIGAALTAFSLVAFVVYNLTRSMAVPLYTAEREGYSRLFGFLEERLTGIEDIRSNGAVGYILDRFFSVNRDTYGRVVRSETMSAVLRSITTILFALGHALTMGMGIYLFRQDVLTIGAVYLVFHYTTMLRMPLFQISRQINDLQKATAGLKRIEALQRTQSSIEDGTQGMPSGQALEVEFDRISFSYAPGEPVLDQISLRLQPGRVLGLLGRTGSGKTTLTRLLFRFYDIDGGQIRIGGLPLREVHLDSLRQRIGMVTQDVQIFNASVRENMALFSPDIDDARILQAMAELGLMPWYETLPDGLDSTITGNTLSAGEAQLLAFARVFLKDPGIIILDEPSSRLDPATEQQIDRAVQRLFKGRTAIVIAHHLGTVQRVDDIAILEAGRLVEYGGRAALAAAQNSRFARLLAAGLESHTA
ncbi:MAG: ATP-binding cassette domain-containing protein [Candidatus Latescibacteria bacterium]|nr:ATP-binding cassette domain-containing protein [Candidatus Latescibacterota bacterium]